MPFRRFIGTIKLYKTAEKKITKTVVKRQTQGKNLISNKWVKLFST